MGEPFIGSEAIKSGRLTPYALRSRFVAVYRDVYLRQGAELTAGSRAQAAWLWSLRQGVIAGQSAAALHGANWVDAHRPTELLWGNRRRLPRIRNWSDRFADDEVEVVNGMRVTTPARTALDIACHYPVVRRSPRSTHWPAQRTSKWPMSSYSPSAIQVDGAFEMRAQQSTSSTPVLSHLGKRGCGFY